MFGSSALLLLATSWAQQPATRPAGADEQAVRQAVDAYAEAFNRGDNGALSRLFTDEAQYVFEDGAIVKGRGNIEQQLAQTLEDYKGGRLEIRIESIEFPRSRIAIVRGTGLLKEADGGAVSSPFRTAYVNRDGKWMIRSVEELSEEGEALEQLAPFIGTWADEDAEASIRTDWQWTPSRRFITRSFVATLRNGRQLSGTEVIGWDPASRTIRSWVFDSDGSFGQALWNRRGEGDWVVKSRGVLPDGSRASAVYILQLDDDDKYTWESINREVDGEIMPDIGPFTIVRTQTQPADALSER